jgi:hypothetical protein
MIQRIQSLFLLASLCFLIPLFFIPVAGLIGITGDVFTFNLTGFYQTVADVTVKKNSQYSIMIFGILICAVNFIIIFLYRIRVLQMRLCVYNILLLIGLFCMILFVLSKVNHIETVSYRLPLVFPVISCILHYLAYRGIRKDELMVQALSRLR